MANMNSKVKFQVDKEASVTLRATSAAAITATTAETGKTLNNGGAYWNSNVTPYETLAVNIFVKSADRTTGDETYTINVEVSDVGSTYVEVARLTGIIATGVYTVLLDVDTVKKFLASAGFIRVNAVLGGTTPILDYDAYLAPIVGC